MTEERRDPGTAATEPAPAGLGAPPDPDRLALEVARAKIAAELFADTRKVELGRYQLLEKVGAGGMGVVWGAWDPQLERRVAIKVVHAELGRARERILEEGQALAKLSHPNVVPIHDVGVVEDRVYLVMEWVRGETLRTYCKQRRTVREIVALYRAAGEGLRAAHAAGLVHRDFKPDNVMVGEDGRVRVVDFGIALAAERAAGAAERAGTPRYMPEEQASGGTVTAAADQYAFCVSLREALVERDADGTTASLPPWLAAIATRGTQHGPADRYPDMDAVLRALARDPARAWRTRMFAAGAVALAAGAFVIGTHRHGAAAEPCSSGGAVLASSWNDAIRDRLRAHVAGLGPYGADEAERLATDLAGYGTQWVSAHHGACVAHARHEITENLYERELACFARSRAAFDTVVEAVTRVPSERLGDAVIAERGLPALEHCAADAVAMPIAPPPAAIAHDVERVGTELARVRSLSLARDPQAVQVATAAAAEADRLKYMPLVGEAQLVLGAALANDHDKVGSAVASYERSTAAALEAGDDVTFVEAYARELFAVPQLEDPATAPTLSYTPASVKLVQLIAKRIGAPGAFARALLYNNAGTERLAAGDVQGARPWFALAVDEQHAGARGVELWTAYGNLALVTTDPTERDRLFAEERGQLERELGPHHALTLAARLRRTMFVADATRARAELGDICDSLEHWHADRAELLQSCEYERGWLAEEAGDRELARHAFALVPEGASNNVELAHLYQEWLSGDAAAAAHAETAAAPLAKEPAWWNRFSAVDALLIAALARDAAGERAHATATLRRALALLGDASFNRDAPVIQRRLARVRALLAEQVASEQPAEAAELARQAIAWYESAGGYVARVVALRQLTAGRDSR